MKEELNKMFHIDEWNTNTDNHESRVTACDKMDDCLGALSRGDREAALNEIVSEGFGLGSLAHVCWVAPT